MNTHPFLNWHYLHLLLQLQKSVPRTENTFTLTSHFTVHIAFPEIRLFLKTTMKGKKNPLKYSFEFRIYFTKIEEKIT